MNKIFSFLAPNENSTVASVHIARFVSETLDLPIIHDASIANEKIDTLFIVNGAFAFCSCLPELGKAVLEADRVIWIQNDYTVIPPKTESAAQSPFRKAFVDRHLAGKPDIEYWTTITDNVKPNHGAYINWNALTYNPIPEELIQEIRKSSSEDLYYYGAFRNNRVDAFDRYFTNSPIDVTISSTSKKFAERYPNVNVISGMKRSSFHEEICSHGIGLYLEDKKSHKQFHSPANRFYEMLSAGIPMVFQPESFGMLKQAGIDVSPYIVRANSELMELFKEREEIGQEQRHKWTKSYLDDLRLNVISAYKGLIK